MFILPIYLDLLGLERRGAGGFATQNRVKFRDTPCINELVNTFIDVLPKSSGINRVKHTASASPKF